MSIYKPHRKIMSINEVSIGRTEGGSFKIDMSVDRSNHACRIKVCRASGSERNKHGTSIPIMPNEEILDYDKMKSQSGVKGKDHIDSSEYLPLITGFATIYQKELRDMIKDDSLEKIDKVDIIKDYWKEYYSNMKKCFRNKDKEVC